EPDALSILPKLVRHYGEPYADSSAIPTFCVAEMSRRHVTVALNGDGGDESFAGYERYLANYLAERMRSVPGVAMAARALSSVIPDSIDPKSRARRARRFLAVASQPMAERYPRWLKMFQDEAKPRLYSPEFGGRLNVHAGEALKSLFNGSNGPGGSEALASIPHPPHPVDAAMAMDVASYLPYDLLVKVDITSMANSLEARSPFLDHEVMEFAARLPAEIKFRGGRVEDLLKTAFARPLAPAKGNLRHM